MTIHVITSLCVTRLPKYLDVLYKILLESCKTLILSCYENTMHVWVVIQGSLLRCCIAQQLFVEAFHCRETPLTTSLSVSCTFPLLK